MWWIYFSFLTSIWGEEDVNQDETCTNNPDDIYKCYIDEDNARVCPEPIDDIENPWPFIAVPKVVQRPKPRDGFFGDEDERTSIDNLDFDNDRDCQNKDPRCQEWADEGECINNPRYMNISCASACSTCRYLDSKWRCGIDPELPAFVHPGDVDRMFENMIANFTKYKPVVLSKDPWLVVLDDFLTPEEVASVLAVGAKDMKRSKDAGKMQASGKFASIKSDKRTSENAWCLNDCYRSDVVQTVNRKMTEVTGIPQENFEYLQVLRYYTGQYYAKHHDYIPGHVDLPIGPRVYTFYIYLSEVEEGGETAFPNLNSKVKPKLGRAVVWPSVYSSDPFEKDHRTQHEARPVIKGVKFGVNAWIHMFNFQDAFHIGCSG